jgi:phospholipase/carboxylesterase
VAERERDSGRETRADAAAAAGRLRTRVGAAPAGADLLAPGVHELAVGGGRPALLSVPDAATRDRPVPLVVVLHGAGQTARFALDLLRRPAADAGVALLAPASRGPTWDVVIGAFGPDVATIDALLRRVTARVRVDASRLAVGGFSDGASYALSLGLTNGDLFTHVLAFSPGFAAPGTRRRRPPVFQSHGVADDVLPIDQTSRRLAPKLRRDGHRLTYREFRGGHTVPPAIAADAVEWMLRG